MAREASGPRIPKTRERSSPSRLLADATQNGRRSKAQVAWSRARTPRRNWLKALLLVYEERARNALSLSMRMRITLPRHW